MDINSNNEIMQRRIIYTSTEMGAPEIYLSKIKSEFCIETEINCDSNYAKIENTEKLYQYQELKIMRDIVKSLSEKKYYKPQKMTEIEQCIRQSVFGYSKYSPETILQEMKNMMEGFAWEWKIINFDNPITKTVEIQSCLKKQMENVNTVRITAYDPSLLDNPDQWINQGYSVVIIPDHMEYDEVLQYLLIEKLSKEDDYVKGKVEKILLLPEIKEIFEYYGKKVSAFLSTMEHILNYYRSMQRFLILEYKDDEILNAIEHDMNIEKKNTYTKRPQLFI